MGYKKESCFVVKGGTGATDCADSTDYFFGAFRDLAMITVGAVAPVYIPKGGTIREAVLYLYSGGAAGTAEAWPFVIRVNDTTDYTFDTQSVATNSRTWTNYSLNIDVSQGDYIEMKTTTPAWAVNPLSTRGEFALVIYY